MKTEKVCDFFFHHKICAHIPARPGGVLGVRVGKRAQSGSQIRERVRGLRSVRARCAVIFNFALFVLIVQTLSAEGRN